MIKNLIKAFFLFVLIGTIGCSEKKMQTGNLFWEKEVKDGIDNCKLMCSYSDGEYYSYNYPTNSCFCKKTDNNTWKTYRIYRQGDVYIETDEIGQIDIKLN